MKTLSKVLGMSALILGLSGCLPKPSYGIYDNHPFRLKEYLNGKVLTLYSDQESAQCDCDSSYIKFSDENKDGRFDSVILNKVKLGDALEKYASLESGQKILNSIIDKKE
jgi:hypothetical protein